MGVVRSRSASGMDAEACQRCWATRSHPMLPIWRRSRAGHRGRCSACGLPETRAFDIPSAFRAYVTLRKPRATEGAGKISRQCHELPPHDGPQQLERITSSPREVCVAVREAMNRLYAYGAEAVAANLEEQHMTRAFQIAYVDLDTPASEEEITYYDRVHGATPAERVDPTAARLFQPRSRSPQHHHQAGVPEAPHGARPEDRTETADEDGEVAPRSRSDRRTERATPGRAFPS